MADSEQTPVPTELKLKKKSRCLEVTFADGAVYSLPAEYLRVHSPSAEITGHTVGEGKLLPGKEFVGIDRIEPVGRYAVKLVFDDGHDTGLYTWATLYELGTGYETKWQRYLERLELAGEQRSPAPKYDDKR
jgi:DUF971 family protein